MSRYDYQSSAAIEMECFPFRALLMAAMRQAPPHDFTKLQDAFPDVWAEYAARYNAPGGYLPGEHGAA
jgi:hypothetical protein